MCDVKGTKIRMLTSVCLHMYMAGYSYAEICDIAGMEYAELNCLITKFRSYIGAELRSKLPLVHKRNTLLFCYMQTKYNNAELAEICKMDLKIVEKRIAEFKKDVYNTFGFYPKRMKKDVARILSTYAHCKTYDGTAKALGETYAHVKDVVYTYKYCFVDFIDKHTAKVSKPILPTTAVIQQGVTVTDSMHTEQSCIDTEQLSFELIEGTNSVVYESVQAEDVCVNDTEVSHIEVQAMETVENMVTYDKQDIDKFKQYNGLVAEIKQRFTRESILHELSEITDRISAMEIEISDLYTQKSVLEKCLSLYD